MSDAINPDHYKRLPAEAIFIIESAIDSAPSNQDAYLHGQVIKYILRCWAKNGIEDLKKAKWYLDRLIDSFDEDEKQKASDLQSLKDYPFGEMKQPAWAPKIPEGYRKLKDSSVEPRKLGDLRPSISQKRYVEIGEEEIGYANRDNWAACRKVETPNREEFLNEIDGVWNEGSSNDTDQDDHPHDFKVGDAVISWQGREGVIEAINLIEDFPITVRHSIREQVSYKLGGVKKKHDDHPVEHEPNFPEIPDSSSDPVNPSHYKQGGIECIEAIKAALGEGFPDYLRGNVMKYLWRYKEKGGVEDLRKSAWYLDRLFKEVGE
jgi:hypothetical protein